MTKQFTELLILQFVKVGRIDDRTGTLKVRLPNPRHATIRRVVKLRLTTLKP